MAKRNRHVYPTDMVAHLWAHRVQDSARNGGSNFYFQGDTIYSYGSHFPIARHVETKRGRAVLFTTLDYSVTTSGHKWTVLGACKHLTVFHIQHPADTDRKGQLIEYRQRYIALARKYSRARSNKPWILGSLRDLVDEANRFAQFFGLRSRLSMPADLSAMEAECRAIEKRERKRKQRAEALRQREAMERLRKWADGETDSCPDYGPIAAGKVSAVVCWRIDRLGRTAKGLTSLFADLQERRVNLVSLKDGLDLSTPAGRLMANVLASVAQFETEVRAERILAGQQAARAAGKVWGGGKPGRRVTVTEEKERTIKLLRDQGKGISEIARVVGLSRPTIYLQGSGLILGRSASAWMPCLPFLSGRCNQRVCQSSAPSTHRARILHDCGACRSCCFRVFRHRVGSIWPIPQMPPAGGVLCHSK